MRQTSLRSGKRLRHWLLGIIISLAAVVALLYLAVSYRPAWYKPAAVPPEQYQALRDELTSLLSSVGSNLHEGKPFRILLTDKQINRWLAGRRQLWPTLQYILPPQLADPAIRLEPGRLIIAVRYESVPLRCLLSLVVAARIDPADQAVVVRLEGAKVGLIGVPRSLLKRLAQRYVKRIRWLSLLNTLNVTELRLPSRLVWPNGQFRFRLSQITLDNGQIEIIVLPLPREDKR